MIEKRAKAYLAWLAEYKGRQLLEYVGTHAPFLLGTFAEFSGYDYEKDVKPKMIKGAAKNYVEKAKTFLYRGCKKFCVIGQSCHPDISEDG